MSQRVYLFKMVLVMTILGVLLPLAAAQTPSHPLSQISPTDTTLNMSNNDAVTGYNITHLSWLNPYGTTLNLGSDVDIRGQSILSFFDSACQDGDAVQDIGDDGTFTCISIAGDVADVYVNESGDSMTGTLNMSFANITGVRPAGVDLGPSGGIDSRGRTSLVFPTRFWIRSRSRWGRGTRITCSGAVIRCRVTLT